MAQQQSWKKTTTTTITSLGNDLIEKIFQLVSANSFQDLFNVKKVCKLFKEISETDSIYKAVELSKFRAVTKFPTSEEQKFLDICYTKNNPEALYNKGIFEYFLNNQTIEGLHLLKRAADGKLDRALYVYAMLQRTLGKSEEFENYIKRLTRNGVRRVRERVMSESNGGWDELLPVEFVERRNSFDSRVLGLCYCKVLENSMHGRKKRVKEDIWGDNYLCDECFWHFEHKTFLRNFPKHISFWFL